MSKLLRIATFNVEWMNNLFVSKKPKLRTSPGTGMGRNPKDPQAVAERIASVISDLDAHIIGIQEGPSTLEQMQYFADTFLEGKYEASGTESGSQSIYALVRKGCPVKAEPYDANHAYFSRLTKAVEFQPWGEVNKAKKYKMARPPALLRLTKKNGQKDPIHLIVAHTKSQFTQGFSRKLFEARDPTAMREAILSRQKLSADIAALRRHVTNVILEQENASGVVLLGDLNDGFTKSVFEHEFLMQSLVDELRGSFRRQRALLDHAFTEEQLRDKNAYTVTFRSPEKKGVTKELIDHILVTSALRDPKFWLTLRAGSGSVAHDIVDKHSINNGKNADDRPSDHAPVFADFDVRP